MLYCFIKERQSGREVHAQAIQAREKDQDFLKSLQLLDEALMVSGEDSDHEDIAGISGSRSNTYQHLFEKTGNKDFLILAKYSALAAIEIIEENNIEEKALPYRDLGNIQSKLEQYDDAVESYKKSLESTDSPSLKRPGTIGEIKSQFGFALYMSGKEDQGLANMDESISELENDTEANKYEHDVWLTGALMRKAKALHDKKSLDRAKEIIDANPELVLRLGQWEKLASEF